MFHLLQKLKIAFLTKVVPELKLQINRSAPFRNNSKYCKKKKKDNPRGSLHGEFLPLGSHYSEPITYVILYYQKEIRRRSEYYVQVTYLKMKDKKCFRVWRYKVLGSERVWIKTPQQNQGLVCCSLTPTNLQSNYASLCKPEQVLSYLEPPI